MVRLVPFPLISILISTRWYHTNGSYASMPKVMSCHIDDVERTSVRNRQRVGGVYRARESYYIPEHLVLLFYKSPYIYYIHFLFKPKYSIPGLENTGLSGFGCPCSSPPILIFFLLCSFPYFFLSIDSSYLNFMVY